MVSSEFFRILRFEFEYLIGTLEGISFGQELPEALAGTPALEEKAPTGKVAVGAEVEDSALSELEARLNNLKR